MLKINGNFMKKLSYLLLVVSLGVNGVAHSALTLSADETVRREEIAGICMLASNGIYGIATDHQNGLDKEKAKRNLAKETKKLEKNFKNRDLVAFINETWHNGLNVVYKMPVQSSKEGKKAFVSQAVEASFRACFDDLDK